MTQVHSLLFAFGIIVEQVVHAEMQLLFAPIVFEQAAIISPANPKNRDKRTHHTVTMFFILLMLFGFSMLLLMFVVLNCQNDQRKDGK